MRRLPSIVTITTCSGTLRLISSLSSRGTASASGSRRACVRRVPAPRGSRPTAVGKIPKAFTSTPGGTLMSTSVGCENLAQSRLTRARPSTWRLPSMIAPRWLGSIESLVTTSRARHPESPRLGLLDSPSVSWPALGRLPRRRAESRLRQRGRRAPPRLTVRKHRSRAT